MSDEVSNPRYDDQPFEFTGFFGKIGKIGALGVVILASLVIEPIEAARKFFSKEAKTIIVGGPGKSPVSISDKKI